MHIRLLRGSLFFDVLSEFRTDVMFHSLTPGLFFVLFVSISLQQTASQQKGGPSVVQNFYGFASAQDIVKRLTQITQKLDELDTKLNSCIGTSSTCKTGKNYPIFFITILIHGLLMLSAINWFDL